MLIFPAWEIAQGICNKATGLPSWSIVCLANSVLGPADCSGRDAARRCFVPTCFQTEGHLLTLHFMHLILILSHRSCASAAMNKSDMCLASQDEMYDDSLKAGSCVSKQLLGIYGTVDAQPKFRARWAFYMLPMQSFLRLYLKTGWACGPSCETAGRFLVFVDAVAELLGSTTGGVAIKAGSCFPCKCCGAGLPSCLAKVLRAGDCSSLPGALYPIFLADSCSDGPKLILFLAPLPPA